MIKGISLTASMRSNLLSLSNISTQMDKIQNILSTGKKVNSAIDNASSYYQARSLTNRAADLNSLLDSMGQGIQTIQAASEGLESATSYLEQMKSVAEQALALPDNSGTTNAPQKVPMQSKVELVDNSAELIAQGYTGVSTSEELISAIQSGANIVLTNDIELTSSYYGAFDNVIINGGGHTLTMKDGNNINHYGGKNVVIENIDIDMINGGFNFYGGAASLKNINIDYERNDQQYVLYADSFIENVNINVKSDGAVVCVYSGNDNLDIKNLTINHTSGDGYVIGAYAKGDVNVDGMSVISNSENSIGLWAVGEVNGVATGSTQNIPSSLTDGYANTQAIVQQLGEDAKDAKAAYATTQFYVGDKNGEFGQGKWYLPSIGELMELYGTDYDGINDGYGISGANGDNLSAINTTLGELAGDGIAEEMDGWYWSSSECSSVHSWALDTSDGYRWDLTKNNDYQVRSFTQYENCFNPNAAAKPQVGDIIYSDGSWGTLADYDSADSDQVAGAICGVGDDGSVSVVSLKDLTFSSSDDAGVFDPEDPYGGNTNYSRWATEDNGKDYENINAITDVVEAGLAAAFHQDKAVSVETLNNTFAENIEPVEPAAATYSLRRSAPAQDNTSDGATAATYSLRRSAPAQEPMAIDEPVEINATYADYIKQYDQLINEFNNLLADASYQGVNLLTGGKLNVTFNESRTHDMTVNGKDMRTDNIGLNMKNWNSKTDIETAIKQIVNAMNEVRSFSADLGNKYTIIQTRQNFTEALCDVLETGADDLVLADMNEASAEYLMLQTRQQLAVNSLSLASQSASSILSLF